MKILIFGAGVYGTQLCDFYKKSGDNVVGFLDNKYDKLDRDDVFSPDKVKDMIYDIIVISMVRGSYIEEVKKQLFDLGVDKGKIKIFIEDKKLVSDVLSTHNLYSENDTRVSWVRSFANFVHERNIPGAVAECGVLRGDFSYYINKYFSNRNLYLFDTFEGFDERDLVIENEINDKRFVEGSFNSNDQFKFTSEEIVLSRMTKREKCIIKKGYFPCSAADVDDVFCFVNLDMDLYQPMLDGLRFFYDKMSKGGVILMHDYFHPELPGVKLAVSVFEKEIGQSPNLFPIADGCSIALIK